MTHIQNIPHILSNGITHSSSPNSNPAFVPIGNASLISSRDLFVMPNGNRLGDYIPFYFGVRMPMLYVIQNGFTGVAATNAQDIVYCVCNVQQIVNHKLDFVFTDGHAVNTFSSFYDPSDVKRIGSIIDRKAIDSKYWNDEKDLDLKRRKEAEFLVAEDIPVTAIDGYAVYNATAQNRLISFGISKSDIEIFSEFYF